MREIFNPFGPFGKSFREVKKEDLEVLKSVAEGWNVEYKKVKLNGKSIAKSISSFANSHGGIYFIGIESDSSNNCAKNIIGVDDSPDVIRDSVRGNLQPFPYFEAFSINLSNGKKVLMAVIPEGRNPPYIHSDGRIYRRQEAASDPIPANNRYTIDELYRKALKYEEELEKFRDFDLTFCRGEGDIPYLEIYVNTVPFNHFIITEFFQRENLEKILQQFNGDFTITENVSGNNYISFNGNMKFDSLNTYYNSVSIRYLEQQDLAYNGLTVEIDISGNLKLLIPLNQKKYYSEFFAERYTNVITRSQENSISSIRFLDARQIFGAILGLINNYVKYLDEKGYKDELELKLRLRNCWRTAIYIDNQKFIAHVENFGVPICMKTEQYFPMYPIPLNFQDIKSHPITEVVGLFSHVANALGLPSDITTISVFEEIQNNPQQPSSS
jgi:predicted HTH transcriptional regulator